MVSIRYHQKKSQLKPTKTDQEFVYYDFKVQLVIINIKMLYKLYHSIKFPLTPLHIKYSLFKQRWQSQSYKNSEYEEEDIVYTLERFDKPWKIHQWECLNDSEIGGDSLGNIEFKENASKIIIIFMKSSIQWQNC